MPSDKPILQARVTQELYDRFEAFCTKTKRPAPDTLRAVVELFLKDGVREAEERLTRDTWDDVPKDTREDVRLIVAGLRDALVDAAIRSREHGKKKSG